MSRLGKLPIKLPQGTEAKIENGFIFVKSGKGELKQKLSDLAQVEIGEEGIKVSVKNPEVKKERAFWGLFRSLINNMVIGLNDGFEKKLEVVGVGFRVNVSGNKLNLSLGFSHPVEFILPEGITATVEANIITVKGVDKQLVGETAAKIRKIKKPEPYKGKGIKYVDEVIRRKEGKTAAK
ncbi:50S ribosomal protein L6 [Candidatus Falkowbacteria bacterium RIFOXYB2_FULL_47_14]|uniref:Large ribosomal subunit protein uL6 n=1 Tax=Candidatus Falkowbacteria bacterium RIFOXYA2_FULL_47_19 TaxID=1797994 RepID=A0A1F5SI37_9BACT|nr:MAG: 50S ribosomal protein L6 [Candidatus Falkowbacteria bacterium RIFOXYA2_FULL_47_19]OGF35448.1 MAG: 50S ribosomal protein L6 [Candidatus Falkowbacteria bacterium RIFOXYC2_FULL_46_15]OGF42560.1 MAG: 50S ribosomal protein L6 [Candidatus Falkowbacteria bacterium RIFOXYB2_FULL_47_14]